VSEAAVAKEVERISIFGLGRLGAVVAGCYASRGVPVIGVDVDEAAVRAVASGTAPVREPGLDELYASCADRLDATRDVRRAVLETDASLLLVPTPSEPDGSYSLRHVLDVCREIGRTLAEKDGDHLVVLKSTVLPGASNAEVVPVLERTSGRRCGEGFGFAYGPEFVALGSVIHDVFHPELCLLGESDPRSGDRVEALYRRLLGDEPPLARMNLVNAELAKLAVNAYVTQKISFANSLALLCERLPGGSVDAVTQAIGRDGRIGRRYLKGGLGFGGPCFPRDNRALLELARRHGARFELAEAADAVNEQPALAVVARVARRLRAGGRVGVLGLAYKPKTAVVERSQGVLMARRLAELGFEVTVFDPLAMREGRAELGDHVKYAESAEALLDGQEAVIVATPCTEFAGLDWERRRDVFVLDCWGLLEGHDGRRRVRFGVAEPDPHEGSAG
jgi:UDPglucose 6-dehydrogenase